MEAKFDYQIKAAKIVLKNALNSQYIASVLAGCPGSGKTTISHHILNSFCKRFPNSKVVVLTEGQNILKNQYLNELENSHIDIGFSYGDFDSDAQVRIGLPQSIDRLDLSSIDLLVVDEAHRFYMADMVQKILNKFNPRYKILMTGTPSDFIAYNKHNSKKYAIYSIAAEDLYDKDIFNSVVMDVVKTIDITNLHSTLISVFNHASKHKDNLSKLMVACPTIQYANKVKLELERMKRKVSISTSENDIDSSEINDFKENLTDTLIVVGRGILGFNDPEITALIDLKSSFNINNSYQLFARLLRKSNKKAIKTYYRIADCQGYNDQVKSLHKIKALTNKKIFNGYDGKNLKLVIE